MSYKILVLEDDVNLSDTIKQFLTLKGYEVFVAYDGEMAQDLLYEQSVDLMLHDVKVAKIDGFGVLKEQRDSGSDIPAIFIADPYLHYVVSKKIRGININFLPDPSQRFAGIQNWYIDTCRVFRK